jgi:arylsulfatase A-like enzyme
VLVPAGVLVGSGAGGSDVSVTNPYRVSYPGYAEILTGEAQPAITGNDPVRIPRETVLEFVRRKLDLDVTAVAAFTSWDRFPYIVEHRPGTVFVNAGARPLPDDVANDELSRINAFQARVLQPWETVRLNAFTEQFALAYLEAYRPRFLYLAFDETDEWAHSSRYDRTVQAIRYFDDTLRLLWERLQTLDGYRDKTTLVITTDHGRGRTPDDWTSHGEGVPGAEETWIAVVGPDTPARGLVASEEAIHQNQIAATIVRLFGLEPGEFNPTAGRPIELAFR